MAYKYIVEPKLDKHYLIPSVIAAGIIPLIVRSHIYQTHLENENWFAIGHYEETDFFLFYKQWSLILLAGICLLILLIRAKYYYEDLPWEKKAFIPFVIYGAFVVLSACFAKKHLFAFAGGYDMFQSALAILSYGVLFYYTYSCIKTQEHVLYFLRGCEYFALAEILICFFQALGWNLFSTTLGKALITSPSSWSRLDQITIEPGVYGTMYNTDYLATYLPLILPLSIALFITEKKIWRKILSVVLLILTAFVSVRASSTAFIAIVAAMVVSVLVLCARRVKTLLIAVGLIAVLAVGGVFFVKSHTSLKDRLKADWDNPNILQDDDIPIKRMTTGNKSEGITVELKDGVTFNFTFTMGDSEFRDLIVRNESGSQLELTETNADTQTYTFNDPTYSAENMYFCRDDSHGIPFLAFVKDNRSFLFTDQNEETLYGITSSDESAASSGDEYYLVSTAGRTVKLPQTNKGEVYEIFSNGFWNGRGPIYNRSLPLLKHNMLVGAGADNFIMVYPQRDYIRDYYLDYGSNSLDVKPHCYYLQLWIQEGFIAFAAAMVFFFWYLINSIRLYRKLQRGDTLGILGFAVFVGIVGCLIAFIANDSNICTGPVFWTMLGAGWGINSAVKKMRDSSDSPCA